MLAKFISNHSSTTNQYQSVPTPAGKKTNNKSPIEELAFFVAFPTFTGHSDPPRHTLISQRSDEVASTCPKGLEPWSPKGPNLWRSWGHHMWT